MDNDIIHNSFRIRKSLVAEKYKKVVEDLLETLMKNGYEVSEQRLRVIYGMLALLHINNAEELWLLLNNREKISRATVYSCLNILLKTGLVVKKKDGSASYSYTLHLENLND